MINIYQRFGQSAIAYFLAHLVYSDCCCCELCCQILALLITYFLLVVQFASPSSSASAMYISAVNYSDVLIASNTTTRAGV